MIFFKGGGRGGGGEEDFPTLIMTAGRYVTVYHKKNNIWLSDQSFLWKWHGLGYIQRNTPIEENLEGKSPYFRYERLPHMHSNQRHRRSSRGGGGGGWVGLFFKF